MYACAIVAPGCFASAQRSSAAYWQVHRRFPCTPSAQIAIDNCTPVKVLTTSKCSSFVHVTWTYRISGVGAYLSPCCPSPCCTCPAIESCLQLQGFHKLVIEHLRVGFSYSRVACTLYAQCCAVAASTILLTLLEHDLASLTLLLRRPLIRCCLHILGSF